MNKRTIVPVQTLVLLCLFSLAIIAAGTTPIHFGQMEDPMNAGGYPITNSGGVYAGSASGTPMYVPTANLGTGVQAGLTNNANGANGPVILSSSNNLPPVGGGSLTGFGALLSPSTISSSGGTATITPTARSNVIVLTTTTTTSVSWTIAAGAQANDRLTAFVTADNGGISIIDGPSSATIAGSNSTAFTGTFVLEFIYNGTNWKYLGTNGFPQGVTLFGYYNEMPGGSGTAYDAYSILNEQMGDNRYVKQSTAVSLSPTGASPTITIDLSQSDYFVVNLSGVTGIPSIAFTSTLYRTSCTIEMDQGSTSLNVVFPTNTKQAGGGGQTYTSSGANAIDLIAVGLKDSTHPRIAVSRSYN